MVDVILEVIFARLNECPFAFGRGGGEELLFTRGVTGRSQDQKFAVASTPSADVETLVCLLVDEHVFGVRSSHDVAKELVLALLLLVFDGIKEGAIVAGPHDGADALDVLCQQFIRAQIFYVQGVLTESCGVS